MPEETGMQRAVSPARLKGSGIGGASQASLPTASTVVPRQCAPRSRGFRDRRTGRYRGRGLGLQGGSGDCRKLPAIQSLDHQGRPEQVASSKLHCGPLGKPIWAFAPVKTSGTTPRLRVDCGSFTNPRRAGRAPGNPPPCRWSGPSPQNRVYALGPCPAHHPAATSGCVTVHGPASREG
jgi:hypothetical protein